MQNVHKRNAMKILFLISALLILLIVALTWFNREHGNEKIILYSYYGTMMEFDIGLDAFTKQVSLIDRGIYRLVEVEAIPGNRAILARDAGNTIHVLNLDYKIMNRFNFDSVLTDFEAANLIVSPKGSKYILSFYSREEESVSEVYDSDTNDIIHTFLCDSDNNFSWFIDENTFVCAQIPHSKGVKICSVEKKSCELVDYEKVIPNFEQYTRIAPLYYFNEKFVFSVRKEDGISRFYLTLNANDYSYINEFNNPVDAHFYISGDGENLVLHEYFAERQGPYAIKAINLNKWKLLNPETGVMSEDLEIVNAHYIGYSKQTDSYYFSSQGYLNIIAAKSWPKIRKVKIPKPTDERDLNEVSFRLGAGALEYRRGIVY